MVFGLFNKIRKKSSTHYFNLRVKEVVQETQDAITIRFEKPDKEITYRPGQFLTLILNIEGKEVRRSYSFSSSPIVDDHMAITVKRVKNGLVSNYLADNMCAGEELRIMEPMGHFVLDEKATQKNVVMFAGGSGITPLMSLLKSTLSQNSGTRVSLIYSNRNEQQIIFKEALHELEVKYHDRLKVIHVLEEPPVDWTGVHGLLNQENLRSIFNKLPLREEDTIYMLCGPEGMMVNAEGLLKNEGIQAGKIMIERFTASVEVKKEKAGKKGSGKMSNVTIVQDGREQTITVSYGASILKTALDQGLDLPFSCQSGVCTACRCKKITGEVNIEDAKGLTEEEIKAGYVLICVGKPAAEEIKLEVG